MQLKGLSSLQPCFSLLLLPWWFCFFFCPQSLLNWKGFSNFHRDHKMAEQGGSSYTWCPFVWVLTKGKAFANTIFTVGQNMHFIGWSFQGFRQELARWPDVSGGISFLGSCHIESESKPCLQLRCSILSYTKQEKLISWNYSGFMMDYIGGVEATWEYVPHFGYQLSMLGKFRQEVPTWACLKCLSSGAWCLFAHRRADRLANRRRPYLLCWNLRKLMGVNRQQCII